MFIKEKAESDYHMLTNRPEDEFTYISNRAKNLGFDYCAIGVKIPLPISSPKTILKNNYSDAWQLYYEKENLLSIDPTIPFTIGKSGPAIWSKTHQSSHVFWEEAASHDLKYGISIAVRHRAGALGMFSMARSNDDILKGEFSNISLEMERLAEIFAVSIFAKTVEKSIPEFLVELTDREKEVLRWTADGKTSEEIAKIVSISVNTVNFHLKQAQTKLNAVNRTQTVVKAIVLNLIN